MINTPRFLDVPASQPQESFEAAVLRGLSAPTRTLPCRFFYDEAGSELFERICDLPEYYPTRTERAILADHAGAIIEKATQGRSLTLIEFGSGSSDKTRILIRAALARQPTLHYVPIDISGDFLRSSAERLLQEYPCLTISAIAAEYSDALPLLPRSESPRLLLFMGSNIGNFEPGEATDLLTRMGQEMEPHDRLLLGVDRVKEAAILEAAYNDSVQVTAAFNKNLLRRINNELGGNFDLAEWEHRAPFQAGLSRIEMWLVSQKAQQVRVAGETFSFAAGERIHTENSHKYTPAAFEAICRAACLSIEATWDDAREWFSVVLLKPIL